MPESKIDQENEKIDKKEAKEAAKKAKKEEAWAEEKAKLQADLDHWKNEYYKAYADTMNLRKSLEEDKRTAVRYRAEGFLSNLLPALDAFNMALNTEAPSDEVKNYLIGFTYIYNQIKKALEDEGVTEIEPRVGDQFDPNTMHAMDAVESEAKPGSVVKVLTKGYKLHDRLVKPAMVTVAKAKAEQKEEKPQDEAAQEA